MSQKNIFLVSACLATLLLGIACVVIIGVSIWASTTNTVEVFGAGDGIGLFNLLVDIVMGVFTIWGLFWAASQFSEQSIKPRMRLLPGLVKDGPGDAECIPVVESPAQLPGYVRSGGRGKGGRLDVGLFLENRKPKIAQHLQIVIEIDSQPPTYNIHPESPYECQWNVINRNKVIMQFEESLIVYMGHGVHIGKLGLLWEQSPLPDSCRLSYTIFKSEGKPDSGTCDVAIRWF